MNEEFRKILKRLADAQSELITVLEEVKNNAIEINKDNIKIKNEIIEANRNLEILKG